MPTAFSSVTPGQSQSISIVPDVNDRPPIVDQPFDAERPIKADLPTIVDEIHVDEVDSEDLSDDQYSDGPSTEAALKSASITRLSATSGCPQVPTELHRIAEVRKQQGLSLRTVARRTGLDVKELRHHELATTDLPLSILRQWQQALEVPFADLVEDDQALSRPVMERAKLVRIMKTAVSLRDACQGNVRLERLGAMLCEQLLDLMPELKEVGSWPQTGTRRGADVMGKIFHEPISMESHDGD